MAQTQIPFGHPLARKVFGAACFAEMVRKPGFTKNLSGPAPKDPSAKSKLEKMQTSPDYPIVRITDLSKGAGDTVSVDLFNILQGLPTMGDTKLSGRMMNLTSSSMDVQLNQVRGGVDTGGRMSQQRTVHDLRGMGRAGLVGWFHRFRDQLTLIQLAGNRGSEDSQDWVIPLDTHPEFSGIVVNALKAPTFNRHFYGGNATALSDMDAGDHLSLDTIDRVRAILDESKVEMQPVRFPDDPAANEESLYVLLVSNRVWHWMQRDTSTTGWRQFMQNAQVRGSKNPIFAGNPGMWNGILVKKMPRAIRFNPGESITVATSDASYTETSVVVSDLGGASTAAALAEGRAVDRCILLGAQALAEVYGRHAKSGTYMNWYEEETDHGNTKEVSLSSMSGCSKLRFTDATGEDFDHGVAVIDVFAPDPANAVVPTY